MGWMDFCLICGASFTNGDYIEDSDEREEIYVEIYVEYPEYEWMNYSYCMTKDGQLVKTDKVYEGV